MKQFTKRLVVVGMISLFSFINAACVGPAPKDDYTFAYVSIESAKAANASKYAPGFLNQAEDYYKQAVIQFEDREYVTAKENFRRAREFAEKAENYSVIKKAQTGDVE